MPLPTARDQTFVTGDDITAEFLNAWVQDHIVALAALAFTPCQVVGPDDWKGDGVSVPQLRVASGGGKRYAYATGTAGNVFSTPVALIPGRTLAQVQYQTDRVAAGGTFDLSLRKVAANGDETVIQTTSIAATLGAVGTTQALTEVVDASARYFLQWDCTNPSAGADLKVYTATFSYA